MAENSKIQWTTHTFNPWRGCSKVSEGCKNCYAETLSGRNPAVLGEWGPNGTRVVAAEAQWREPVKWNRAAYGSYQRWQQAVAGSRSEYDLVTPFERPRVFCASLADVFEGPETMPPDPNGEYDDATTDYVPRLNHDGIAAARERLFRLIDETPYLDWLLLTKRPENVMPLYGNYLHWTRTMSRRSVVWPPNVWIGVSVENQKRADERLPVLCSIPARVRFVSYEPALGPVDFRPWLFGDRGVNWVIAGGESGGDARPFDPAWARVARDQCGDAGIPFFMKQMGASPVGLTVRKKGGELDDIPADLRVRETPASAF